MALAFLRRLGKLALLAAGVSIAVAISVLLLPVVLAVAAVEGVRSAWFRHRHRGRGYLVASRRNGWDPFIANNVVPVLPPGTEVVFLARYGHGRGTPPPRLVQLARRVTWGRAKPYWLKVRLRGFEVVELHEALLPFKHLRARDPEVQERVRHILDRCELSTTRQRASTDS